MVVVNRALEFYDLEINDYQKKSEYIILRTMFVAYAVTSTEVASMSIGQSRILEQLVGSTPLTEPNKAENQSNDAKTVAAGIISHSASVLQSATATPDPPPLTASTNSKPKGNLCPRCGKPVYFAEEIKAAGQSFHKLCYRCANCKKSINGANFSEHDGDLYDNNCYQRLFGPKGVGYGIGAGTLSTGT